MRFSQQIALITGAGSGIGKATAIRLADEGAKVILVGRTRAKLLETAYEINETKRIPMAEVFPADVTDREDILELADYMQTHYGDLHILVNNAGAPQDKLWKRLKRTGTIYDVNLKSVFLVTKALAPLMIRGAEQDHVRQNRAIVNVASLSGHQAGAQIPHYSAAKAGVINLTKAFALELAPYGIRVNSVSPGFVESPLIEDDLQNPKFLKMIERHTALKRIGKPEEIANVIVFAASEDASYMTGSDILVDGGWLIK